MHYNEFQAVKLARQLIENDDDEDEDDEGGTDEDTASDQPVAHVSASSEATTSSSGDTESNDMMGEDLVWLACVMIYLALDDLLNCAILILWQSAFCRLRDFTFWLNFRWANSLSESSV